MASVVPEMINTAWGLLSWTAVEMSLEDWLLRIPTFKHCATVIHAQPDEFGVYFGHTLWISEAIGHPALGIAWDWREVCDGVVALDDPLTILSNVRLFEGGQPLATSLLRLQLNNAVYQLPWALITSQEITEFLRAAPGCEPTPSRATVHHLAASQSTQSRDAITDHDK